MTYFLNSYGGLGDSVLLARQVARLISAGHDSSQIAVLDSAFIRLLKMHYQWRHLNTLPPSTRHCLVRPRCGLILSENQISEVVNARFDSIRRPTAFKMMKDRLIRAGIQVTDMIDANIKPSQHIRDSIDRVIEKRFFNGPRDCVDDQWLQKVLFTSLPQLDKGSVLIAPEASWGAKEMSDTHVTLATDYLTSQGYQVSVLAFERAQRSTHHNTVRAGDLLSLLKLILETEVIISVDSFVGRLCDELGKNWFGVFSCTDPLMYGPYRGHYIQGSHFNTCNRTTIWGNCDGWDSGCDKRDCKRINNSRLIEQLSQFLRYKFD